MTDATTHPSLLRRLLPLFWVIAALVAAAALVRGGPGADVRGDASNVWTAIALTVDALTGALAVAGVLMVGLVVWALTGTGGGEMSPRPASGRRAVAAVAVLALVPLAVWLLQRSGFDGALASLVERVESLAAGGAGVGPPATAHALEPAVRMAAAAAGALVVLAAAATWWLRVPAGPPEDLWLDEVPATPIPPPTVDPGSADLVAGGDPRRAVLRCYAELDSALARAGCPRRPSETPREHGGRAARLLGPGADAAADLVDRFEHARYGSAAVTEHDRQAAVAAVAVARDALAERGSPREDAMGSKR